MKEIPLTQGKAALVDDADYNWLMQWKWRLSHYGYVVRCERQIGKRVTIYLHVAVFGTSNDLEVDHKNGDKLDCQQDNLRIATHAQNGRNRGKSKVGVFSSRFKGVHWLKTAQRWRAKITVGRKQIHLGQFTNELDAALAYDTASRIYHGDFGRTNF